MENNLGKITQLFILTTILSYSFEKCSEYRINSFYYDCWMKFDVEFCYHFDGYYPMLECSDLNFTMVGERGKTSSKIMRVRHYENEPLEIESKSFVELPGLRLLDVRNCYVEQIHAGAFHGLSKLELLDLRDNEIRALSEEIFQDLDNLIILLLANNKIDKISLNTFRRNVNLHDLYISNNEISDMMSLMASCVGLTYLDISNNNLRELKIANNTKLRFLNIASNKIESLSKESFGNSSIIFLDISNNILKSFSSNALENLKELEQLNMSHNAPFETGTLPTGFFQNSEGLKVLNLSSTSLRKINVGSFSPLRNLEVLDLSKNELTYLPSGTFHSLPKLRKFYINSNRFSYLSDFVRGALTEIDLNDNLWNCDILSSLLHQMTHTTVIKGNVYNSTNISGIKCREVIKHEKDILDPKIIQHKYLSRLVDGANEMTQTLNDLENFLNETDLDENSYSTNYLRNTLYVTDLILYAVFIGGLAIFAALVYVYYKKNNRLIEY